MKINDTTRSSAHQPFYLLILFFFLWAWLFCTGCSRKDAPAEKTKAGGVLYFGIEAPFHGFDVLGTSGFINPTQAPLNNLIQEPLFRMDASGNLIPILGLNASPSSNGSIWDIQLRQGVFFHDNTPFNADSVIHHWSRILDPANRYRGRTTFQPIRSVAKIDDYTVRFTLDRPWPPFLEVISDELWMFNFIPSPTAIEAGVHDRKPVGTGPFKYHKWNSGDHFVVLKNERYWQKEKPLLNKVVFRVVPDHQARYASLLAGQIDIITLDRGSLIEKARNNPELYAFHSEGNGAEIIMINTSKPPLDDIRVRRALALANNQALHIKMVYGDTIPFIHHPFGEQFSCGDDGYLAHDPEQAKQLIADYGRLVEIECLHSNTSRGRDIGAVLQQLFKPIGVKLTPIGLSTGPHVMKVMQKDYQLATWRIPPSRDHGPQLYRNFHSQSTTNFTGYGSQEMDQLLEMQRIETDAEERDDIWCQIVQQLNSDVPFLYRGGGRFHIVARKKIRDMMESPGFMVDLASAWMDEKVKFNTAAYEIEQNASVSDFDCPDPGDVDTVKGTILGAWKGKDSWGATITMKFNVDDTVDLHRTGGSGKTVPYRICSPNVYFQNRASIEMTPVAGKLEGVWSKGEYKGEIVLERNE